MSQAHIKMAENGRVVIPANLRAEIGLSNGGDLVARIEDGSVILEPYQKVLERMRRMVRQYAPAAEGQSVVDELIAERRAEAERE